MSNDEVALVVSGIRYAGWKSIRITRSIESIAGSFALDVSDKWDGTKKPWTILEEDACRVEIGGEVVIDGYVDKRSLSASSDSRTLGYEGRDRAGALVDCSAILRNWTRYNVDVAVFAREIAAPFGIEVSVQPGLKLDHVPKVAISPGDSAFEAIKRAAADSGVLLVSDGAGGVLITRAGTERASPLVEAQNILSASVDYDGADRFRHYVISTQPAGTDEAYGDVSRVLEGAADLGVRRVERALVMQPDKGYSAADAKRRADWEARIRAARAMKVNVTVQGWRQSSGKLWRPNTLTRVVAPKLVGVDGDMLISQVEFSVSDRGTITQLGLVRPDAFTPEPKATVAASPSGLWPELAQGGKTTEATSRELLRVLISKDAPPFKDIIDEQAALLRYLKGEL